MVTEFDYSIRHNGFNRIATYGTIFRKFNNNSQLIRIYLKTKCLTANKSDRFMSKNPEAVTCTARLFTRSVNNLNYNKQTITLKISNPI